MTGYTNKRLPVADYSEDICCTQPPSHCSSPSAADCADCGLALTQDSNGDICKECCCCFDSFRCPEDYCALIPPSSPHAVTAKCRLATAAKSVPVEHPAPIATHTDGPICVDSHCDMMFCARPDCIDDAGTATCVDCDSSEDRCGPDCYSTSGSSVSSSTASPVSTTPSSKELSFCDQLAHNHHQHTEVSQKKPTNLQCRHNYDPDSKVCHWGDDCAFSFTSTAELDTHLRTSHISFLDHQRLQSAAQKQRQEQQQQLEEQLEQQRLREAQRRHDEQQQQQQLNTSATLSCQWDSCGVTTTELDALLSHIKNTHVPSFESTSALPISHSHHSNSTINPITDCHWSYCSAPAGTPPSTGAHLVSQMRVAPHQCEWNSCHYRAVTADLVTSHHTHEHAGSTIQHAAPIDNLRNYCHQSHWHNHGHRSHSHDYTHHQSSDSDQMLDLEHKCLWVSPDGNNCDKIFDSTHDLSEHIIADHVGSRKQEYTCLWQGCERLMRPFSQRQKIVRHLQIHTHDRPFTCSVCERKFSEHVVLAQHMRVHSGEKPYICKACGKRFAASTALSVHLRTHTGEKPLKCKWPDCGRSFSESSNLAKHMKIHRADKRFKCEVEGCQKEFLRHDQFVRHMKIHDADRLGGCEGPKAHVKQQVKKEEFGIAELDFNGLPEVFSVYA
ncbi:uncharacterized protein V2V93DRAFT_367663 [Kockiozyma suomiensis]|uniref:uncharacterized protein n=1 Tax=Kockiozyma suomiensis TaxID=1337062 RepID=UPI003342F406